jgi:hypothetical protein
MSRHILMRNQKSIRFSFALFLFLSTNFLSAGAGPRFGRNYGLFVGAGSPPISAISAGGVFNPYPRLKLTLEAGGGFNTTSSGASVDFLFNPNVPFSATAGIGYYHMHISDGDIFFDDGIDDSKNIKATGIRLGFDWMTSYGFNITGGVGLALQKTNSQTSPKSVHFIPI